MRIDALLVQRDPVNCRESRPVESVAMPYNVLVQVDAVLARPGCP